MELPIALVKDDGKAYFVAIWSGDKSPDKVSNSYPISTGIFIKNKDRYEDFIPPKGLKIDKEDIKLEYENLLQQGFKPVEDNNCWIWSVCDQINENLPSSRDNCVKHIL